MMRATVHAGEIYVAPAHRGTRRIRVDQVRGLDSEQPYALVHEVLPSGRAARGLSRLGIPRTLQVTVYLRVERGVAAMPSPYARVEPDARVEASRG